MTMGFVYILQSDATDRFYVGSTDDLERRLAYGRSIIVGCESTRFDAKPHQRRVQFPLKIS
jgi:predicted GIY-YIG superfamily endonuclease